MSPALAQAGMSFAAIALIIGAVISFVTGTAPGNGTMFREALEPALSGFRGTSGKSRSELADGSVVIAIGLSGVAAIFESLFVGILIAFLLWKARPMVRRMVSQENPMLAIGDHFSTDLVIGLYFPVVLAHFLMGRFITASAMMMVVVALSWPAGGGAPAHSGGPWRPAWNQA